MDEERDKRLEEASDRLGVSLPVRAEDIRSLLADYRALQREKVEGIVALCVCENAATPRPDCPCVTCTVKRADQRAERAGAERDRLREALAEILEHVEMQHCDVIGAIQQARAALASGEEK